MSEIFLGEIKDKIVEFDDHEVNHMKVMRIKVGSQILFTDGKGKLFRGKVLEKGLASVEDIVEVRSPQKIKIHVMLSPVKWERMRFIAEKVTELETSTIVLLNMDRTTRKESESKLKKISMVVRDAVKQSGNLYMPEVMDLSEFEFPQNACKVRFDLDADKRFKDIKDADDFVLLFGPEGGFTEREKEKYDSMGFERVKLTDRTLRVETAVIVALGGIRILKGVPL
ncbi:MAG: 16S rRNA (uracil(1498)-N(3))-methyltransferase [Thermotogae bacterium]|nr:16S rRNA (uracil(1498)-N(3))-methyltransferase [Thermotogota bacterium]MCL5033307.1 16S rRNA (uracil(1498)-N(3))-methyltransferase [Thermotogota bacterium]